MMCVWNEHNSIPYCYLTVADSLENIQRGQRRETVAQKEVILLRLDNDDDDNDNEDGKYDHDDDDVGRTGDDDDDDRVNVPRVIWKLFSS